MGFSGIERPIIFNYPEDGLKSTLGKLNCSSNISASIMLTNTTKLFAYFNISAKDFLNFSTFGLITALQ